MYVYCEDGPLKGQIRSIPQGQTEFRVIPPIAPMTESFTDAGAPVPLDTTFEWVIYRVIAVTNHPSGCDYKAMVS